MGCPRTSRGGPLADPHASGRATGTLTFPASCILVGAMNPCPCGFRGLPEEKCVGQNQCLRYGAKITGPLRDRIDIHVDVPRMRFESQKKFFRNMGSLTRI